MTPDEFREILKKAKIELPTIVMNYIDELEKKAGEKKTVYTVRAIYQHDMGVEHRIIYQGTDAWDDDYTFDGANGYTTFIFDVIIKHYIPDFEWDFTAFHEQTLDCLDGNGYGLFCL